MIRVQIDLFDFVIDAKKLIRLLRNLHEVGEINENVYFLIEDQLLIHCDSLVPESEGTT